MQRGCRGAVLGTKEGEGRGEAWCRQPRQIPMRSQETKSLSCRVSDAKGTSTESAWLQDRLRYAVLRDKEPKLLGV
ncbi:hypothetical protein CBR_g40423 [Chara braunii]|uniref:Uncharacterized protein n=1 Tax=Chara braunii TaxID=69332 RepID=A0A388LTY0_CHABU|nr:hypothetical protein CBR_g40423 [Chara braunii]|eukprot:GBG85693.1 hypothetical protein CBR_g40423 [Chara braunii]